VKINAVTSGVADAKAIIERARTDKAMFNTDTFLILDECHRWNKAQSDCVLEAIEDGSIFFIGTTTENPYTSMTRAIVSRCRVFEFKPLTSNDIKKAMKRALSDSENGLGNMPVDCTDEALDYFAFAPQKRGKGYGSTALKALLEFYEGRRMIIEIETTSQETDNLEERIRRKRFYHKNGITDLGFMADLFGVRMEILSNNTRVTFDEYLELYVKTYGERMGEFVKEATPSIHNPKKPEP